MLPTGKPTGGLSKAWRSAIFDAEEAIEDGTDDWQATVDDVTLTIEGGHIMYTLNGQPAAQLDGVTTDELKASVLALVAAGASETADMHPAPVAKKQQLSGNDLMVHLTRTIHVTTHITASVPTPPACSTHTHPPLRYG